MKNGKQAINKKHLSQEESAIQRRIANPVCKPVVPDVLKTVAPCPEVAAEYLPDSGPNKTTEANKAADDQSKVGASKKAARAKKNEAKARTKKVHDKDFVSPSEPLNERPQPK